MNAFKFKHVCLASCAVNFPESVVTSAEIEDRLSPLYQRLGIPFGTLEKLSGISTRYFWDPKTLPSQVATVAAEKAIEQIGIDRNLIGAVFNCSVSRDYFEPATGCIIHRKLGIPEKSLALDISNACIGFSDGVILLSNLIESGVVKAGVVVSAETVSGMVENGINYLRDNQSVTREELLQLLPTFTLGSGAAAWVLCHESLVDQLSLPKHKIIGGVVRSATQLSDLCTGNADYCVTGNNNATAMMRTEAAKIIGSASKLGARLWQDYNQAFEWTPADVQHIFCHQVGKQVTESFYSEMSLDIQKEFTIYRKYGNLVSAALPAALTIGVEEKPVPLGSRVLLTAFGSGLNGMFIGLEW